MVKTENLGLLSDAQVLSMAASAYDAGRIPMAPIDLVHAVELLVEAGELSVPRNYYGLTVGESQYNEEFDYD